MKIFFTIFLTLSFALSVFAQKQAQVIVTSTFLRKEPNSNAEKVQTVQKGDKLTLERSQDTNGWNYVSVSNRAVKGWIRKDTISPPFSSAVPPVNTTVAENQRPKRVVAVPPNAAAAKPSATIKPPVAAAKPPVTQSPAPANTPAEEEEIIRVNTEEVSLNVRVVDADNRAVKNLNQAQFKVYEDDVLQPVTSLTTTEIPIINALVIDNSRSLRFQLRDIIEAGKTIVATNRPADESAVIRFVGADKIEVAQDFTHSKLSLYNGLENMLVEGGQTAIIDAVYLAAKKIGQYQNSAQKDDARLRALVLVSDGDDRASLHTEEQLFDLLRNSQVQVYAVGFVNNLSKEQDASGATRQEKAKSLLTRLAQETGGRVYFPASINELPLIASTIAAELHTQYLISYTPTNEKSDGTFRRIKVSIDEGANKEKKIAITRAGRISAKKP